MESLVSWFRREVYHWRLGASVVWTVFSVPPVFLSYRLFVCFHPFHLFQWISDFLLSLVSVSTWGCILTVMTVMGILAVYNSSHFSVIPEIPSTRFAAIASLGKVPCLIHASVFSLAGGVVTWCVSGQIGDGYNRLSQKCSEESEKYCLNEYHLVLICYGVFVGFLYHLQFWLYQDNYIQFPSLQQAKFFRVKGNLWTLLTKSLFFTFKYLKYFFLGYYLLGHIPRNWILRNLHLELRGDPPVDSIFGMLDIPLIWHTALAGTLLHFILIYSSLLYKVYNSEPYPFPIESTYEESKNKCLHNVLACQEFPLVKYLGFLDLYLVGKHHNSRRGQLFVLSQPGGHPHNWRNVLMACIAEIDALNQTVEEYNWRVFSSAPLRPQSGEKPVPSTSSSGDINLIFRGATSTSGKVPCKPGEMAPPSDPISRFMENLKKKAVFKYIFADLPESSGRKLFSSAQIQIWAIEALSAIVAASYSEDPYGIVQRSLPDIMASLLNLQENVEKHFKLAPNVSRRSHDQAGASDMGLRHSLRSSLKTSIYRIVNVFGGHLSEVKLTSDHAKKLKFFLNYKE